MEKLWTISVLTENRSGLLNGITIIFTRRKLNIESINVSESEVEGVSRYTIVLKTTREQAEKVVKQIQKLIDVLGAFLYEEENTHFQEMALYKVPTEIFIGGNKIEQIIRDNAAKILVIERDYIVIEKTGHKHETKRLYDALKPHGLLEFVSSARISISKSKRKTETFLKELEEAGTN
jgi:acetolactate synthase I/III small subunit